MAFLKPMTSICQLTSSTGKNWIVPRLSRPSRCTTPRTTPTNSSMAIPGSYPTFPTYPKTRTNYSISSKCPRRIRATISLQKTSNKSLTKRNPFKRKNQQLKSVFLRTVLAAAKGTITGTVVSTLFVRNLARR